MRRLVVALLAWPSLGVGLRDHSSHPPPAVSLPVAGETYTDPVFGTRILRVTDERDGQRCVHAYSTWEAMNLDSTRLLLSCDGEGRLYRFDGDRVVADGSLAGDDGPDVDFEGASWSHHEAHVIHALDGRRLWRLDVSRRGMAGATVTQDFEGLFPYPFRLAQLSMSGDDRVFTFHSRDPQTGAKLDVAVFDVTTGATRVFPRDGWAIDESRIDKTGRWVMVSGAGLRAGFRMWDLQTGAITVFAHDDPDARAGGHADLGRSLFVNGDGWETGLVVRAYGAQHGAGGIQNIVRYLRPDGKLNWSIADHASLRSDAESFVVGSTYGGDGTWGAFEDEIYLAYTDGSGFVRLAHTRSDEVAADRGARYWAQPRAVVDRAGRHIVFTSDLGSSARTDVLLLFVPRELWPAQTPALPLPTVPAPLPETGLPAADAVPGEELDEETLLTGGCSAGGRAPVGGVGWVVLSLLVLVVRLKQARQAAAHDRDRDRVDIDDVGAAFDRSAQPLESLVTGLADAHMVSDRRPGPVL